MKTTIVIDDEIAARLRQEAARRGASMSSLVEDALRRFFDERPPARKLSPLPIFDGGRPLVDVSDREALFRAMEEDS